MLSLVLVCALVVVGQCAPQGPPANATLKQPLFEGNSTDLDKNTTKMVWEAAYKSVVNSSFTVGKMDLWYEKWFGAKDEGRLLTVQGTFLDIKKAMETVQYTLHFNAQECERNEFSETSYGSTYIYLCKGYLRAQDTRDFNSKLGTIIYSLAISVSNMMDFPRIDTPDECRNLALDVPLRAIRSAYNYEYYSEDPSRKMLY